MLGGYPLAAGGGDRRDRGGSGGGVSMDLLARSGYVATETETERW
jgi:hypothetical protein